MKGCISGKKIYPSQHVAEEALIGAHTQFNYNKGNGPVAVYLCEDCGNYHLTSQGPMNERLAQMIRDGELKRQKDANQWENKFRRKR